MSSTFLVAKVPELAIAMITRAAAAKAEAFEQMSKYWELKGCNMEAFEARRLAKDLGL